MKNKLKKFSKYLLVGALFPFPAFAAGCDSTIGDFQELVSYAICLISNSLIPLAFAIALVIFVYGVVKYIAKADDEEARKKGRNFMIWGLLAIFVMVSVWGFVKLIQNSIKLDSGPIVIPEAPTYP